MSSLDLISLVQSQPFRPFRIHTLAGGAFDVTEPGQVGISPGKRMLVVVLSDGHFEVLTPELIKRCEVITERMPAVAAAAPPPVPAPAKLSNGRIEFKKAKEADGRRLVHIVVTTDEGSPIVSTVGTRWDLSGIETFENGRTLQLDHADDPSLFRRVIVWPPGTATFESFAESIPGAVLQQQLRDLDAAARSAPKDAPGPGAGYFKSIEPPPGYEPPMPRATGRESGMAPNDPERFVYQVEPYEAGANQWCNCPTLVDAFTHTVMFDLSGTNWDASQEREGDIWTLLLRYYPDAKHALTMVIDPKSALAHFGGPAIPLHIAARHLKNFELHESWEGVVRVLNTDLKPDEPHVRLPLRAGFTLEFWPGEGSIPPPFLTARLVSPSGRAILDLRDSLWGLSIEPDARANPRPFSSKPPAPSTAATLSLSLIHAEEQTRYQFREYVTIDLASQRVTSSSIPGATTLAAFGRAVHECRTAEWLLEDLTRLFALGKDIPLS